MSNVLDLKQRKKCRKCGAEKPLSEFRKEKRNRDGAGSWCTTCSNGYSAAKSRERYANSPELRKKRSKQRHEHHKNNPEQYMLNRARSRASKQHLDFNLELSDIVIPDTCPLLHIPIIHAPQGKGQGVSSDNTPSLDRIDPGKGYIKGNVKVISFLANMMKNKGTPEQIKTLARNIDDYVSD